MVRGPISEDTEIVLHFPRLTTIWDALLSHNLVIGKADFVFLFRKCGWHFGVSKWLDSVRGGAKKGTLRFPTRSLVYGIFVPVKMGKFTPSTRRKISIQNQQTWGKLGKQLLFPLFGISGSGGRQMGLGFGVEVSSWGLISVNDELCGPLFHSASPRNVSPETSKLVSLSLNFPWIFFLLSQLILMIYFDS